MNEAEREYTHARVATCVDVCSCGVRYVCAYVCGGGGGVTGREMVR
jgi:hypothetical protein